MATTITSLTNDVISLLVDNVSLLNQANLNAPLNELKQNIVDNKSSIDSLNDNKVETDLLSQARGIAGTIPTRDTDGNTIDVDITGDSVTVGGKSVSASNVVDTIPLRDETGTINANVIGDVTGDLDGNAASATTLSVGADRDTLDALGNSSTRDVGTLSTQVAAGDHLHDDTYFNIDGVLTKMMFFQTPLPPGWTVDTGYEDRTVLLTDTLASVGNKSGNWTISGMSSAGGHNHITNVAAGGDKRGRSELAAELMSFASHTHITNVAGSHTHAFDGNWRPAYAKAIVGQIDKR